MILRKCRICGVEAEKEEELIKFKKHKRMKHGHDNICLNCSHREVKGWKQENRDLVYQSKIKWREKNPEKLRLYYKETRKRENLLPILGPPFICYFCGKVIEENPVALHSIDGDHDNWNRENKTPVHMSCHGRYHRQKQMS